MATMKTLNGYGFNATELGGKAPEYYIQPRNLLDNSDFTNPVNQRGANSLTATGYFIDRWATEESDNPSLSLGDGYLTIGNGHITQRVPDELIDANKSYTIAAMKVDGTLLVASGIASNGIGSYSNIVFAYTYDLWRIYITEQGDYLWAALYEGSYTADTLPPYVPKGYAAELAECQRYYYKLLCYWKYISAGICVSATQAYIPVYLPQAMRVKPTVTIADTSKIKVKCGSLSSQVPSDISWVNITSVYDGMYMSATVTGATAGSVAMLYFDEAGSIEFSADL